jgi:hypothetical protein
LRRGWRRVRPASEGKTSSRVSGEPRWPLGGRSARTAAASCKRHGQRCRNAAARPGSGQGWADEMALLWFGPSEDSDRAATSSISPLAVGQNNVKNEIISFRPATTVFMNLRLHAAIQRLSLKVMLLSIKTRRSFCVDEFSSNIFRTP